MQRKVPRRGVGSPFREITSGTGRPPLADLSPVPAIGWQSGYGYIRYCLHIALSPPIVIRERHLCLRLTKKAISEPPPTGHTNGPRSESRRVEQTVRGNVIPDLKCRLRIKCVVDEERKLEVRSNCRRPEIE